MFRGTFYNTIISRNCAFAGGGGGGGYQSVFIGCVFSSNYISAAAESGTLSKCIVTNNSATGAKNCYLDNCLISGNFGSSYGGVLYNSSAGYWVRNCTIVSNYGSTCGGLYFSGVTATVENCVIYDNHNSSDNQDRNIAARGTGKGILTNCCVMPTNSLSADSVNNIEADPQFANKAAGDWRLSADSPCVNAGINRDWMTNAVDLDDRTRIRYGTVDMGAYERVHGGTVYRFR